MKLSEVFAELEAGKIVHLIPIHGSMVGDEILSSVEDLLHVIKRSFFSERSYNYKVIPTSTFKVYLELKFYDDDERLKEAILRWAASNVQECKSIRLERFDDVDL